jgi:hypothetical protein
VDPRDENPVQREIRELRELLEELGYEDLEEAPARKPVEAAPESAARGLAGVPQAADGAP